MRKYQHIVTEVISTNERFRSYVKGKLPFLETNNAIKKALKRSQLFLNDRLANSGDYVKVGDVIELRIQDVVQRIDSSIDVAFMDQHLMIINKPPGMASSGGGTSLQGRLIGYTMSEEEDALPYPLLVHRLDYATCGLLIAARTISARRILGDMLERNELSKSYLALVEGWPLFEHKSIAIPIEGKAAKTEIVNVRKLPTKDKTSLLYLRLHTGKTHQIRIHLKEIGFPIVGDNLYNNDGLSFGRGLFLTSNHLRFMHPITQYVVDIEANFHSKFSKYIGQK